MSDEARENVNVRFSKPGVKLMDERRGTWSRSEFVRQAVKLAVAHGLKGPSGSGL